MAILDFTPAGRAGWGHRWQFTLTRRVLDTPTRTSEHTYTVESQHELNNLVVRASNDPDIVGYTYQRYLMPPRSDPRDERSDPAGQFRWRPCECHGHLVAPAGGAVARPVTSHDTRRGAKCSVIEHGRSGGRHSIVVSEPTPITSARSADQRR